MLEKQGGGKEEKTNFENLKIAFVIFPYSRLPKLVVSQESGKQCIPMDQSDVSSQVTPGFQLHLMDHVIIGNFKDMGRVRKQLLAHEEFNKVKMFCVQMNFKCRQKIEQPSHWKEIEDVIVSENMNNKAEVEQLEGDGLRVRIRIEVQSDADQNPVLASNTPSVGLETVSINNLKLKIQRKKNENIIMRRNKVKRDTKVSVAPM